VTSISPAGNTLTMSGNVTGTSNGTPTTTGILSNGVVVGTWTLSGGAGDSSCAGSGNFIMCQGTSTCSTT
jgi:predicted transcriptional regulator